MSRAGIATATGTRLDSAAKHTMPYKINTDLLLSWFPISSGARLALHTHKYKYCIQKDELVLTVAQGLFTDSRMAKASYYQIQPYCKILRTCHKIPRLYGRCVEAMAC